MRRGDGRSLRRRARPDGDERRNAGDGARPLPQRQLRERPDRRIGGQRRRCEEALHGPTFPVGVGGGVRQGDWKTMMTQGARDSWKNWEIYSCHVLFPIFFLFAVIFSYFYLLEVKQGWRELVVVAVI